MLLLPPFPPLYFFFAQDGHSGSTKVGRKNTREAKKIIIMPGQERYPIQRPGAPEQYATSLRGLLSPRPLSPGFGGGGHDFGGQMKHDFSFAPGNIRNRGVS